MVLNIVGLHTGSEFVQRVRSIAEMLRNVAVVVAVVVTGGNQTVCSHRVVDHLH